MGRCKKESGLTEIMPLLCTLAIWGQYPVFSYLEIRAHLREWLQSDGC